MQTILTKIVSLIIAPVMFLGGIISPVQAPVNNVGAVLPQATGVFETSLASPISSTATSMTLTSNSVRGGGAVSGYTCLTLDEGSAQAEVTCGTVASTAVSSLTRGVSYADGVTSVTANKFSHRRGANVKITDFPILQILKAQNNGDATFPNKLSYNSHPTFTADEQIVDKKYIDDIAIAGGVDATTTVKGISKMSVAPASSTNPIAVGDNDGRVPTQDENNALVGNNTDIAVGTGNKLVTQTGLQHNAEKYAVDAGANDTYVITLSPVPTSYTNGMVVHFKANTINTGAATLNVNSLGAKTIVKYVNTALANGDIAAGMFCTVIYDGTNFVLQNPIATVPITSAPFPEQHINLGVTSGTSVNSYSNSDGTILVTATTSISVSAIVTMNRFTKDANTGQYNMTHQVTFDNGVGSFSGIAVVIIGNYVYLTYSISPNGYCKRFDLADLTNATTITISGTSWDNWAGGSFTDGTNLYASFNNGTFRFLKYTISGTTITYDSTLTYNSQTDVRAGGALCDGTYVWISSATDTRIVQKYALAGGAALSTTTYNIYLSKIYNGIGGGLFYVSPTVLGLVTGYGSSSPTALVGVVGRFSAITLP